MMFPLYVILGVGGLARLLLFISTQNLGLTIIDEQHYVQLALNLINGHGFALEPGHPTSLRPPLYPAFLSLIWWVSGTDSLLLVRIVQGGLSLLSTVILYAISVRLFNPRVAWFAAGAFCFYPSLLGFNVFLLTETVFVTLFLLFIWGYVVLYQTGKMAAAFGSGVVLGLASLTRSMLWPLSFLLGPLILLTLSGGLRRRGQAFGVLLLGFVMVVGPWAARNTLLQGKMTVINTQGGIALLMGNSEVTDLNRAWDPMTLHGERSIFKDLPQTSPDGSAWTEGKKEQWAQQQALHFMKEHPWLTLQRSLVKFANFWGLERTLLAGWQQGLFHVPRPVFFFGALSITASYVGVMGLAGLGVFCAPAREFGVHVFLLLLALFFAGIHSVTFGHSRYHLPLIPVLMMYAASAVERKSWRSLGENKWRAMGPVVVWSSLLLIWGREVLVTETSRIRELFSILFA